MKLTKIAFVGLYDDQNFGDPIIGKCTEWLVAKSCPEKVNFKRLSLDYVNRFGLKLSIFQRSTYLIYRVLCRLIGGGKGDNVQKEIAIAQYKKYYKSHISDCDAIIVVGGGLIKYTTQYFGDSLTALLTVADKYHIPVMFNAFGVEGYEEGNERCEQLRRLTGFSSLKSFTVRDDLDTLNTHYLTENSKIKAVKVADPAVWAAEAFNVKTTPNSNLIGLGVARSNIFESYGIKFYSKELVQLYIDIAESLIKRGDNVEVFTNGLNDDNITAKQLVTYLREKGYVVNLNIPKSPQDLIEIEAKYKGIIATRLHATIIAYSLNIPVIGLVWNDKLNFFGKNIGRETDFIRAEDLNVKTVCNRFYAALNSKGYDETHRDNFRNSVRVKLDEFISDVLSH